MIRSKPFDPRSIAGLELWYDCDLASLTIDKGIRTWADKSGNGRSATQTATNNQPALIDNGLANRPVAEFDGLNDSLSLPFLNLSAWTIFIVCSRTAGTTNGSLLQIGQSALGVESAAISLNDDATNGPILVGAGSTGTAVYGKGGSLSAGTNRVLSAVWAGAGTSGATYYAAYDNGTAVTLADSGSVGKASGSDSRIGAAWLSGSLTGFYRGRIAEILVYSSALSDSTRQAVEIYTKRKWAL